MSSKQMQQTPSTEYPSENTKAGGRYTYLLNTGVISYQDLQEAMRVAKKENLRMDDVLVDRFKVNKQELGRSLQEYYDTEFVPFDQSFVAPFELFEQKRLDPEFLKKYEWVPLEKENSNLVVLVNNPYDLGRLDEIRFVFGTSNIVAKVATPGDIRRFIDHFHQQYLAEQSMAFLGEEVGTAEEAETGADYIDEGELTEHDSEVVRLVNALLLEAWRKKASDIHIEPRPGSRYCLIRMRMDGTCHEFKRIRLALAKPLVSRLKIMSSLDIAERRLPQDGKLKIKLPEVSQCKVQYTPDSAELQELETEYGEGFKAWKEHYFQKKAVLYRAKGCRDCIDGYRGRLGIHELMPNTDNIKRLIKFRKSAEEIREQAGMEGMLSLKQDGILKVLAGLTDIHQVRAATGA